METPRNLMVLLNLLEDEFASFKDEGVRVRAVLPSGTRRSPDLEQDYDPDSNFLTRRSGVTVQTSTKEFFFHSEWVNDPAHAEIHAMIQKVRDQLG